MQPIRRDFSIERGDAVNVVFLLTQLAPTGSVPLDPAGSTFELVVSWPGGSVIRSTADGTLTVITGATATQVRWTVTEEVTASLPLNGTTYSFARITPGGGRRTYATGSVKALPWGLAAPGDIGVGISTNAGEPIIALEVTDYGVISASTDTAVAASQAATVSSTAAAASETRAAQAAAAAVGTGRIYDTLAQLQADLAPAAGSGGQVLADGNNTGLYVKTGAPGAGGWSIVSRITLPGIVEAALAYLLFNVKGDDVTDDTAAIKAYAAYCLANNRTFTLPKPRVRYLLTDTISLRYLAVDAHHAIFRLNHDKIGFIMGGDARVGYNPAQSLGNIIRATAQPKTNPCVRAIGVKGQRLSIHNLYWLQIWADYTIVTDGSSGYSNINVECVNKLHLDTPATGGGWINENQFWVNRVIEEIYINGNDYRQNHNKFYNCNLENTAAINIQNGADNKFYGCRFEAGPTTITFGANSQRNVVICTWTGAPQSGPAPRFTSGTVTDLGSHNKVIHENALFNSCVVVASADISDVVLNTRDGATTPLRRAPTLQRIGGINSNVELVLSEYFPPVADDCIVWNWEGGDVGDTVLYRPQIALFDKNLQPVAATSDMIVTGGTWGVVGNLIRPSTGQTTGRFAWITKKMIESGVAFIRVAALGSSGQLQNALARRISIINFSTNRVSQVSGSQRGRELQPNRFLVTGIPTQGFAPLGFEVMKTDGTAIYRVIKSHETVLTAVAASGALSVDVANLGPIAAGDRIGINMDNRDTLWSTVSSITGSTVTFGAALPAGAAVGSRVVIMRWATIAQTLT